MADVETVCKKQKLEENKDETATSTSTVVFNMKRVKVLRENEDYLCTRCKGVVYWMARDQRVRDNWAMIYAQQLATKHSLPLYVVYSLSPDLSFPTRRRCEFLIEGLKEVERECRELN